MSMQARFLTAAVLAASTFILDACDGSVRREGPPEVGFQVVRVDAARNRRWVLELESLTVYDDTNGRRLRRLILPDWVLAGEGYACPPDLVLDSSGAAFVSSNVLPMLWRVGSQRFEVTRIELTPGSDGDKDLGFTGLSFAADGVLIAAGATFGSLWRIDLQSARAARIGSYPSSPLLCSPEALLRAAGA